MATYASSLQAVHRPSAPAPYLVSNTIDIAVENTENAAALAANDILQIFTIPTDTLIMAAGYEVEALLTGESNDTTFNLGITTASTGGIAADVDEFVAAMDTDAMAVGAYATMIPGVFPAVVAGPGGPRPGSTFFPVRFLGCHPGPRAGCYARRLWRLRVLF